MQILDLPPNKALGWFRHLLQEEGYATADDITNIAAKTIKYLNGNAEMRKYLQEGQALEKHWYESLAQGQPDYGVYDTDYYLGELWACWIVYSRQYLRNLTKAYPLHPNGITNDFGKVTSVADLGCGFGFTTAALTEMFPGAKVYGTNIPDTPQTNIANKITQPYGAVIIDDVQRLPGPVDVVFASEYFEHFQEPIDHLNHVIRYAQPRVLITANAFTADAIGHFNHYLINGHPFDGKTTSKLFAETLNRHGYTKQKTNMWNNRPTYWKRTGNE